MFEPSEEKENIHPSASNIIKQLQSRIEELEEQNIRNINLLNIASGDFQKAAERIAELEEQIPKNPCTNG